MENETEADQRELGSDYTRLCGFQRYNFFNRVYHVVTGTEDATADVALTDTIFLICDW